MFFVGRTPDFLCKGSLSLLEISTTSMPHFFLRDSHFPPAAQINLLLPEHPGHGWQWLCDRRAKRKESSEDGHSHKAPELSIQLPDLLFLESIHCSFKNKGPILWAAQWSILNSWSVFVYVQSQALPSAKTHHWHRTESQWGCCITVYSFLTWRKGVEIEYLQLSNSEKALEKKDGAKPRSLRIPGVAGSSM